MQNTKLLPHAPRPVMWTWDMDDGKTYPGMWGGDTWNGFPNIWVSVDTHKAVLADMVATDGMDMDTVNDLRAMTPTERGPGAGWISYGWGFTPRIVEESKVKPPPAKVGFLAGAFVDVLWEWLTDDELRIVKLTNAEYAREGSSACASHNFCDANMAMDEAFKRCFGRESDTGRDDDLALINAAWDIAKTGWLTA